MVEYNSDQLVLNFRMEYTFSKNARIIEPSKIQSSLLMTNPFITMSFMFY